MANATMLNLPVATGLDGSEYAWINQGGTDKRATLADIANTASGFIPFDLSNLNPMLVTDSFTVYETATGNYARATFPNAMKALTGLTALAVPNLTNDYLIINRAADNTTYKINVSAFGLASGNLPAGGTRGQLLAKNSSTDYDATWSSTIFDGSGNTELAFTATASAVNYLRVTNNSTGGTPLLSSDGETNVPIRIASKAAASVFLRTDGTDRVTVGSTGIVTVSAAVASTNTSTGAIVLSGASAGIGLPGAIFAGGNVNAAALVPTGASVPSNGMYLPSANTLGFATNSGAVASIGATGIVTLLGAVASTTTGTGTLVLSGASAGIGLAGALFAGGNVNGAALVPTGSSVPANGVYLPAANTVSIATNTTERFRVDSVGAVQVGAGAITTGYSFSNIRNITGAVSSHANVSSGTVQSDVTTQASGYLTLLGVQNAAFTLPILYHYRAAQGTFGGSATITNQYGFAAGSNLTGAGTNYGFWTDLAASGAARFAYYSAGSAPSLLTGILTLASATASTSTSTGALVLTGASGGIGLLGAIFAGGNVNAAALVPTGSAVPANGMYLPSANTVSFATASTERMRIDSAGNVQVGAGATTAGRIFSSVKQMTGAATSYANATFAQIQSDVTTAAHGFFSSLAVANASFTLPALYAFRAIQGSFGGSATVTSQFGFIADNTLIGATTNYGFYSLLAASGATRYAFYAAGTAPSLFAGVTSFTVGTAATSTTTGSVVVTGGIGASGAIYAGGLINSAAAVAAHSATAIPAGGTAGAGFVFSSTANFGMFFGSGAPTLSAAQGSLYLRSDGSSTSTRLYVNTNGSTTWTNLTSAA